VKLNSILWLGAIVTGSCHCWKVIFNASRKEAARGSEAEKEMLFFAQKTIRRKTEEFRECNL